MHFLVLTAFVIPHAVRCSLLGRRESNSDIHPPQGRDIRRNTNGTTTQQAVVECAIKHEQNIDVGSFVPLVNVALGSPPQEFSTILDTGSGDFIVGRSGSDFCKAPGANCSETSQGGRGSFNLDKSAELPTVGALDAPFFSGERDFGEYRRTDAALGGVQVPGLQFGLADNITTKAPAPLVPLLGVGPFLGETGTNTTYPNLPQRMRDIGVIKSNVFGVYLNDFRGQDGSIVFGGVDTAKFTGELKPAPLIPDEKGVAGSFRVEFSSFQLVDTVGNQTKNQSLTSLAPPEGLPPAFIDTGNAAINIPQESLKLLVSILGAELDSNFLSKVKCESLPGKALRFGFNRDNAVIDVPLEMLVVPNDIATRLGKLPPGMCNTIIGSSGDLPPGLNIASLGAPIMQAMYVAFDAERSRLLFAPAVINSTRSDLRELGPKWMGTVSGTGGREH